MKGRREWLVKFVLHAEVQQHRAEGWSGERDLAHHGRYAVLMERATDAPQVPA